MKEALEKQLCNEKERLCNVQQLALSCVIMTLFLFHKDLFNLSSRNRVISKRFAQKGVRTNGERTTDGNDSGFHDIVFHCGLHGFPSALEHHILGIRALFVLLYKYMQKYFCLPASLVLFPSLGECGAQMIEIEVQDSKYKEHSGDARIQYPCYRYSEALCTV